MEIIILKNFLIVLNYNDAETTLEFVEMAKMCNAIDKIVVVDNCSTDYSLSKLTCLKSDKIDVIQTDKNGGYAYGNNFGCRYAEKNYNPKLFFISNPDVRFENPVLQEMDKLSNNHKDIGVVAPIVNQGYNIWNLPKFWGLIESIFLIWFSLDKRKIKRKMLSSKNHFETVGVVEGSFFAISREAYDKIDGFDEKTFLYCEENILARRLLRNGYKEAVLPKCRYDHFHSVSIKKHYGGKVKAFKNFHKSMLIYLQDYLDGGIVERIIFEICFGLGYIERYMYDIYMKVRK